MLICRLLGLFLAGASAAASQPSCLPNSIGEADRHNLTIYGRSAPLGIWTLDWDTSKVVCHLAKILLEEALGYHVALSPAGSMSTTAIYALGGCDDGQDCAKSTSAENSADATIGRWHLAFETWPSAEAVFSSWTETVPRRTPDRMGSIGYSGSEGHYVKPDILSTALSEEGWSLDWYRSYNVSWFQPSRHFDSISDIGLDAFEQCADVWPENILMDYHKFFSTDETIHLHDGRWTIQCEAGKWWISPSCRANASQCVPYITYQAWGNQMLQQASYWGMPIAVANVKTYADWTSIVSGHRVLTFWFEPDMLFVHANLHSLVFPPYNAKEWSRGFKASSAQLSPLYNWASKGLGVIAHDAHHLAGALSLTADDIKDMLRGLREQSHHDAACAWLNRNVEVWQGWLPPSKGCVGGQGQVNADGEFVSSHGAALGCEWCSPGRASSLSESSNDRLCLACSAGTFQSQPGQDACVPCPAGKHTGREGQVTCEDCPVGSFAPGPGNETCSECSGEHETTRYPGAPSVWECVCSEGFYRLPGHSEASASIKPCVPCPGGMRCAVGNEEPTLIAGFWAHGVDSQSRSYTVYRCREVQQCPGGEAGSCAAGREGVGCSHCKAGHSPSSQGMCEPCGATSGLPAAFATLAFALGLAAVAVYARVDASKVKYNLVAVGICFGQMAVAVQTLSIFRLLRMTWVEPYSSLLSVLSVLRLDVDVLQLSCFFPDSFVLGKYLLMTSVFPAGVGILCLILVGMKKCCKKDITIDHVINSVGLLTLLFFLPLTMTGLRPFHCVSNPSGSVSMESDPSIICYTGEMWTLLSVVGVVSSLVYGVLFSASVVWVTIRYPRMVMSEQGMLATVRFRFMFQRFTVSCYYFTPIYMARSILIAIVPVAFADYGHRQIFLLTTVLICFGSLQMWLQPWRGLLPNLLDTIVTSCLVMSLLAAGLLTEVDGNVATADIRFFLTALIVVGASSATAISCYLLWRYLCPRRTFSTFLCHHKASCGAGARLMKIQLEQRLKAPVFLDADSLDSLEELLDIVQTSIRSMVVLLTRPTLSRPWCAGEIAVAFLSQVPLVPVAYDDYQDPSDDELTESALAETFAFEMDCITRRVPLADVQAACVHLRGLPKLPCLRLACRSAESPHVADSVAMACTGKSGDARRCSLARFERLPSIASESRALEVAILADCSNGEAISSAAVLSQLLRGQTQWRTVELLSARDVEGVAEEQMRPPWHLAVILTDGALSSHGFSATLAAASDAWGGSSTLTTLQMGQFAFPTRKEVRDSIVPSVAAALCVPAASVAGLYDRLLNVVSVPFDPGGSVYLLKAQMSAVIGRMQRVSGVMVSLDLPMPEDSIAHTTTDATEGSCARESPSGSCSWKCEPYYQAPAAAKVEGKALPCVHRIERL